jgi:hypothetical protein
MSTPQLALASLSPLLLLTGRLPGLNDAGVCDSSFAGNAIPAATVSEIGWPEAIATANALVHNMTRAEKISIVRGLGWNSYNLPDGYYVGSNPALPRLGIPSINMHDGPAGFRTTDNRIIGTVTQWPSHLALGATWDASLAHEYGVALAREFRSRGANVVLGPGVNIARVAHNGRLPEYSTGEEPLLGAVIGAQYVRGVQSMGVAAVIKHFVANVQETLRTDINAVIDQRSLHEVVRNSRSIPPPLGCPFLTLCSLLARSLSLHLWAALFSSSARCWLPLHPSTSGLPPSQWLLAAGSPAAFTPSRRRM